MLNVEFLENYRTKRRLSKGEMAELIGVTQSNYSNLLRKRTTQLWRIADIAKRLKVSAKKLIDGP